MVCIDTKMEFSPSETKLLKVTDILLHLLYHQQMEKDCQEKRNIRSSEPIKEYLVQYDGQVQSLQLRGGRKL